jgi:hypothetical protein
MTGRPAPELPASGHRDPRSRRARPSPARTPSASGRDRAAPSPATISHTQSGASSTAGPLGNRGMRSRRHPARFGTMTSAPRCTSGSMRIHPSPRPPRPLSNGPNRSVAIEPWAYRCSDPGRGETNSSPPTISPTTLSGSFKRSSYVARALDTGTDSTMAQQAPLV